MQAEEKLYVLAPGEGEAESEWVSPQPINDAFATTITGATDLDADEVDDVENYADIGELTALLDGDSDEESMTISVEGHEVVIDGSGQVSVDPS